MTQLLELELFQFFAIKHQVVKLAGQGRVLVVGANGAGKTALLIEGPYYALFGRSFEYGERPGDAVGNRFHKSFMTRIDFEADGQTYRVIRAKGVKEAAGLKLNRTGLFLFRKAQEDQWEDISLSRAVDTQENINKLVGMTPLTFTNTTTFSSDVLRLPDFPDTEKKRIINELLGVGSCDTALKTTTKIVSDIGQEIILKDALLRVVSTSLQEATKRVASLEEASSNWAQELADKAEERASRKAKLEEEIEVKRGLITSTKDKLKASREAYAKAKEAIVTIRAKLTKLTTISEQSKLDKPGIGESSRIRQKLEAARDGACSECGKPFDESLDPAKHKTHISTLTRELAAAVAKEKEEMDEWKATDATVTNRRAQETRLLEATELNLETHNSAAQKLDRSLADLEAKVFSIEEQLLKADEEVAEEQTNPYQALLKESSGELIEYTKNHAEITAQLTDLRKRLVDEKLMQELFGNRGCRVNRLETALPFLNEKCIEVAQNLETELRASFLIRGEDESHSNTVEITVDNPLGAGQYHGNSAGERRLADLIILFSLLSLATASHNAIGQAFFDETFEKLFPSIKNNVMKVIGAVNDQRNSVFIISHVTEGLDLDLVDQIWTVSNGEIEVNSSRV